MKDQTLVLKKLVAVKRQMSEQRLKNLSDALLGCQTQIKATLASLDGAGATGAGFDNLALSAVNQFPKRIRLQLLKLGEEQDTLRLSIEAEQGRLRKMVYSEQQLARGV